MAARAARPLLARFPWLLLAMLAVQAGLSFRLVWSNTAFGDEALYLWAGHLELSHWEHGTSVPAFQTWFSGAPIIYPPLGALADSLGGLAGARILSMAFMLGATTCLYGITARMFSRRAACYGIAVYIALAPTQALGAFATYDAMAIFLLALATWVGVRSSTAQDWIPRVTLLLVAGIILALADATKYASTIFDPVVVLLVALAYWQKKGYRDAIVVAIVMCGCWLIALGIAIYAGGRGYWHGVLVTTLARPHATSSAGLVLHQAFNYAGAVMILALFGLLASFGANLVDRLICATVLVAVLLAPVNQARIHTTVSLYKHVDFGALFGCIAAGYVIARVSRVDVRRYWHIAIGVAAAGPILLFSIGQAADLFSFWPNSSGYIAALRPLLDTSQSAFGHYSTDEQYVIYYYLRNETHPGELLDEYWDNPARRELNGLPADEEEIRLHYLSAIELDNSGDSTSKDAVLEKMLASSGVYQLTYESRWTHEGQTHTTEVWELKGYFK